MAQRNPLNERYQQREGGKTRKSAASAKPVSKAASSVYIKDPNAKPKKSFLDRFKKNDPEPAKKSAKAQVAEASDQPKKKGGKWTLNDMTGEEATASGEGLSEEAKKEARKKYLNPGTKDYKKWRTLWWIVIACGIISLIPPVMVPQYFVDNEQNSVIFFALGYGFLIAAVAIDAIKIRPLRKAARGGSINSDRSKEATAARKQAKKEAIAKEEAKAAKKAARKRS